MAVQSIYWKNVEIKVNYRHLARRTYIPVENFGTASRDHPGTQRYRGRKRTTKLSYQISKTF